jgi:hypothetical protein
MDGREADPKDVREGPQGAAGCEAHGVKPWGTR